MTMSRAQQNMIMDSSVALGKLEVSPSSSAGGVSPNPRITGGTHGERSGQVWLPGTQGQTHLNGCVPLTHQVAGHKFGVDKVGILQHPDGTVLKQVQPPPRGPRETQFYSMVYAEDCCDPCLLELQNHLPTYYGTWSSPESPNDVYLKLEDVTRRFIRPCIMDVKLGQQSYDPFASEEKREQQIRKYPLMEEIGFLILGMRVYNISGDTFESYDQHYGRGLDKETVKDGLAKFFHNGVSLRKDAISGSIRRVQQILHWFHSQNQLVFYASSLLFVYEGLSSSSSSLHSGPAVGLTVKKITVGQEKEAAENNNNIQVSMPWDCTNHMKGGGGDDDYGGVTQMMKSSDSEKTSALREEDNATWKQATELSPKTHGNGNKSECDEGGGRKSRMTWEEEEDGRGGDREQGSIGDTEVEVRMIDFAHVFPSQSQDHGYIYGLKRLLTVLEQILCDAAHTSIPSPSS